LSNNISLPSSKSDSEKKETVQLKNRAGESRSPYVRAHKGNPVAWQIWGDEAISLARRENRLLFVSIGYSACHCESSSSRLSGVDRWGRMDGMAREEDGIWRDWGEY
jgi:hypothetical protein